MKKIITIILIILSIISASFFAYNQISEKDTNIYEGTLI